MNITIKQLLIIGVALVLCIAGSTGNDTGNLIAPDSITVEGIPSPEFPTLAVPVLFIAALLLAVGAIRKD
ncbi:MAG: hypothetical protein APR53_04615 [Methanoculleus sp. SDB]|nr:MAG: hypothetical protein APR53_04615 [Methanoculleus sp. SDB]